MFSIDVIVNHMGIYSLEFCIGATEFLFPYCIYKVQCRTFSGSQVIHQKFSTINVQMVLILMAFDQLAPNTNLYYKHVLFFLLMPATTTQGAGSSLSEITLALVWSFNTALHL